VVARRFEPTSGCVRGTIHRSLVSGNTVTASNTAGDANRIWRRHRGRRSPRAERLHDRQQPRWGEGADRLHSGSLRRLGRNRHGRVRDDHRLATDRQLRERQGTGRHGLGDVRGIKRRERSLRNHDQAQRHQPQPTRSKRAPASLREAEGSSPSPSRRSATPPSLTTDPTYATDADAVPPADEPDRSPEGGFLRKPNLVPTDQDHHFAVMTSHPSIRQS
jgi:hypothetical protein